MEGPDFANAPLAAWLRWVGSLTFVLGFTLMNVARIMTSTQRLVMLGIAIFLFFTGWMCFMVGTSLIQVSLAPESVATWKTVLAVLTAFSTCVLWFITITVGKHNPVLWGFTLLSWLFLGVALALPNSGGYEGDSFRAKSFNVSIGVGVIGSLLAGAGAFLTHYEQTLESPLVGGPAVAVLCAGVGLLTFA